MRKPLRIERDRRLLVPAAKEHQPKGPVVLVIMDGVGLGRGDQFDAVATATTPTLDGLLANNLWRTLRAHGSAVGLSTDEDMGNSEVGHNTLGAGRIFDQGVKQVDLAIETERIWGDEWRSLVAQVLANDSTLHLIGLLSDGRVHSSIEHLLALLHRAASDGVRRLRVHALLDGRDVPDFTALDYVDRVEDELAKLRATYGGDYQIGSGGGRMTTTMDRYGADWGIVEAGWKTHVLGTATAFASARAAITHFRELTPGISDQYIPSFTIADASGPVGTVHDGDAVLVFNFRGDRSIELSEAFCSDASFDHFDRQRHPDVAFASMTVYDFERSFPAHYLVQAAPIYGTLSEYLAKRGVRQFAAAESQKFGHVTYFWNGNRMDPFDPATETYVEIPSDRVRFETRPQMKSEETGALVAEATTSGNYDFIRTNFAGGDMVGHSASIDATRQAIQAIDAAIGVIDDAVGEMNGCLVVTADHGNAEDMVERDTNGDPLMGPDGSYRFKTSHSLNPVIFVIKDYAHRHIHLRGDLPDAGLANVAATLVELLGYEPPVEYEPALIDWE